MQQHNGTQIQMVTQVWKSTTVLPPQTGSLPGGNHKQDVVCVVRNGRRHSVFISCVKDPDLLHVITKVYIKAQVFQLVSCSRDWFLSAGWWKMDGFLSNLYHIDFSAVFYMHAGGHSTAKCILNTHHNKIACRISKFTNASIVLSRDFCKGLGSFETIAVICPQFTFILLSMRKCCWLFVSIW